MHPSCQPGESSWVRGYVTVVAIEGCCLLHVAWLNGFDGRWGTAGFKDASQRAMAMVDAAVCSSICGVRVIEAPLRVEAVERVLIVRRRNKGIEVESGQRRQMTGVWLRVGRRRDGVAQY